MALSSLKLEFIDLSKNSSNIMIDLLGHQLPDLIFQFNQDNNSIQRISKMAKNNREKYEEITITFISTLNNLNKKLDINRKQINNFREYFLKNGILPFLNKNFIIKDLIKKPPILELICEEVQLFCLKNEIEKYENLLQQFSIISILNIFSLKNFEYSISFFPENNLNILNDNFKFYNLIFNLIQNTIYFEEIWNYFNNLFFLLKNNFDLIESLIPLNLSHIFEFSQFLSFYFSNKQRILKHFSKEQNEFVSNFVKLILKLKKNQIKN